MVSQKCAVFIGPPCRPIYDTADTQLFTKILYTIPIISYKLYLLHQHIGNRNHIQNTVYESCNLLAVICRGKTYHVGMKSGFLKPRVHLCFSKVELRGKFDTFRS